MAKLLALPELWMPMEYWDLLLLMGSGRYVDLISHHLVLKTPNSFKSQVWYFDNKSKTIKSRRSQYSIGIQSSGSASNLAIYRTTS
jgi:hypothetical protein